MTNEFYLWYFENYCDSDAGHYGRKNRDYEYGISVRDMMAEFPSEAIEDAKKDLEKRNIAPFYKLYIDSLHSKIEYYINEHLLALDFAEEHGLI